jgi:YVTN family beta-propeller protein
MEFRVLGQLEVSDGSGALPLERAGQRSLLAVLLLHRNESVSTARLVEELWPEGAPATAAKIVQLYVSQLRKVIGPERLLTTSSGYMLRTEPGEVDAERFECLVDEAAESDPGTARELLARALALWRGPAFGEVADGSSAQWEAARLDELRLSAVEDRVDRELALGRHAAVAAELPRLIREYPLRERLRGQLMLALYRAGRQSDALEAYRAARETLVDELGLEPSPPLQRLEQAILRHDPALELAPAPDPPARATNGRVEQPAADALAVEAPAGQRSHLARAAVAAGILLAAAAVTGYLVTRPGAAKTAAPNSLGVIDPASNRLVAAVAVGHGPSAVDVGGGAVWVVNGSENTVSRIDPKTTQVVRTIGLVGNPTNVATGRGGVWVATAAHALRRIDPTSDLVVERVKLPTSHNPLLTDDWQSTVASGGAGVWGTSVGGVSRVEPRPQFTLPIRNVPCCAAIAVGGSAIWVTEAYGVLRIDAHARLITPIPLSFQGRSIAAGAGGIWVTQEDRDAVWRLDPQTSQVSGTVTVGDHPVGVVVGGGAVWVATTDGTVARIDPTTDRVVRRILIGGTPRAVAYGFGRVWVAVD